MSEYLELLEASALHVPGIRLLLINDLREL